MMEIIRGSTPTLIYTFDTITADNISAAYLLINQRGSIVIEKHLDDATISEGKLMFTLTQADTLKLNASYSATVILDWKTGDGVRGRSRMYECDVSQAGKNEVI